MVGPIYDDYVAESPNAVLLQNDDREKEKKHTLISRILGFVAMGLSLIGMLTLFAPLFEVTILSKVKIGLRNIFEIKDLMDYFWCGFKRYKLADCVDFCWVGFCICFRYFRYLCK